MEDTFRTIEFTTLNIFVDITRLSEWWVTHAVYQSHCWSVESTNLQELW